MKFDIVFVTYNSAKWLDNCLKSILKNNYNLKNITLIFYDNNSSDDTVSKLEKFKNDYLNKFNDFIIVEGNKNKGFGYGNNEGAKYGSSPYIFFLNVDTEINENTLQDLSEEIINSPKEFAMWELAQKPYEHPKYYDPITKETSWASGACMVVRRKVFEDLKGFDTEIFMYCEDVDISWNFRKHHYKIKYLYNVPITHYSYTKPYDFKLTQFVYGYISNYYIRAKYGKFRNFLRGLNYLFNVGFGRISLPKNVDKNIQKKARSMIRKALFTKTIKYTLVNLFTPKSDFKPTFINGLDYEIVKENGFFTQPDFETNTLVSILVRTCARPDVLRETLISLRNQTYKNFEIVVVEDGKDTSRGMIENEFADLNINYMATNEHKGRSAVGNIAISRAKGKYLNFLDDDDLFLPDHIETLVKYLELYKRDIAYTSSFETKIQVLSKSPYKYNVKEKGLFGFGDFSKKRLYKMNLFPIQSVMFKKSLLTESGGFDENIDALEDWDFWIRLSLKNHFYHVNHTTSIFRTPYKTKEKEEREEFLRESLEYLENKFVTYKVENSVYDYYRK